jgi:GMP synthase-like glutamine amidotransferase
VRPPEGYGLAVKPILVIEQEEPLEGLGLLGERLRALGLTYRRLQTWREGISGLRARDFAGIVPMGGNMHAWDEDGHPFLRDERGLLAQAVDEGVPVLGICLGAQLLTQALGADVRPGDAPEIGWLDVTPTEQAANDPLFAHLDRSAGVFQWHVDGFELPAGATHLALSERFPNQAFRFREAWGVQFHPEVDFTQFAIWIGNHPGAAEANGIDEGALREEVRRGSDAAWFGVKLFDAFGAYVRTLAAGARFPDTR